MDVRMKGRTILARLPFLTHLLPFRLASQPGSFSARSQCLVPTTAKGRGPFLSSSSSVRTCIQYDQLEEEAPADIPFRLLACLLSRQPLAAFSLRR